MHPQPLPKGRLEAPASIIFSKQCVCVCVCACVCVCVCVCACVCMSWCLPVTCQYLPVTAVNTTARLTALRQQMYTQNLSAYIVPDTDAHMVRDDSSPQPPPFLLPRPQTGLLRLRRWKTEKGFDRQRKGSGEPGHGCFRATERMYSFT